MKFKKIYIEITNICNLACHYCAKTTREKLFMSYDNFNYILDQIKPYTSYIYLHVMGEPLMHPLINDFIKLAHEKGFYVNITTNGFLLDRLDKNNIIRQINISLHAIKEQNNISSSKYLNKTCQICEDLSKKGTYINYRLWRNDTLDIQNYLNERYQSNIDSTTHTKTLAKNIFFSREGEFVWPNDRIKEGRVQITGTCLALKDHLAILVDGSVVPCCLDNDGKITLGNIFHNSLKEIMATPLFLRLQKGFQDNKRIHPLCEHCTFYNSRIN